MLIIRTSQLAFKWWSCVLKCYKYSASQSYWHPDELKRLQKRSKFRKLRILYSFVRLWLLCKFILIYLYLHCEDIFCSEKNVSIIAAACSVLYLLSASTAALLSVFHWVFQVYGAGLLLMFMAEYIMSRCEDSQGERGRATATVWLWPRQKYTWFSVDGFKWEPDFISIINIIMAERDSALVCITLSPYLVMKINSTAIKTHK